MEATPFEQEGDEAVATNCTVVATLAPLLGAVTTTPANAELAKVDPRHTRRPYFFIAMQTVLQLDLWRSGGESTTIERILWIPSSSYNEKLCEKQSKVHIFLKFPGRKPEPQAALR
jgi:hypothetical protein